MINVYIDPFSNVYLSNKLFDCDEVLKRDTVPSIWCFLKKYCLAQHINLNTIDFYNKDQKSSNKSIYVTFNHKRNEIKKILENNFSKKILFQFEPPAIEPYVYKKINDLFGIYDKIYLSYIVKKNSKCRYFYCPQSYNGILKDCFENTNRKFLTLINANKKPRFQHGELYSKRIDAITFFAKTNDVDLYGFGWNKPILFFPYWLHRRAIKKVYRGSTEFKYQTLSKYNFAICFENCTFEGYITEKIFDCFVVGTIPIYYGAPDIEKYIPKNCFIDMRDFKDYSELRLFLKSLTPSQINSYKTNIRNYLESEQYKPFRQEHFAKTVVDAILEKYEK